MKDQSLDVLLQSLATQDGSTLWVADENLPLELLKTISLSSALTAITNRVEIQYNLEKCGIATTLSDFDFSSLPLFDKIIYRISKEKLLTHHCINQALSHLSDVGELILIGNKHDGLKSIAKNAAEIFKLQNATKKVGTTYTATFNKPAQAVIDSNGLPTNGYGELRLVEHPQLSFYSKPGVFGWEKIDKGSLLLTTVLPTIHKHMKSIKSIMDLGCGWGHLMLATKDWEVATRCATDNNVAAIDAATRNFAEANLEVTCIADDCGSTIRERFDLILCNPPFHQGFAVSDSITDKFLQAAARMSRRSTRSVFVVNQFIPLDTLAEKYFSQVRLLTSDGGFCVYELRS